MPETEDNKQVKEPFGGDEGREKAARTLKGGKPGMSYPNRLLTALMKIIEDPNTSTAEKLQAINMSKEILPYRKTPRRKTEKEKLVIATLKSKEKKP